jgi:acyl dehydratase
MAYKVFFEDVKVGDEIPPFVKQTDFMHWNRYAAINDEFVYIHMDDEAGKNGGNAQGAFGMGNLRWAYLHNMFREWAGDEAELKEMSAQWRAINQKNDILTTYGKVIEKKTENGENLVRLEINVMNQDGKGTAPGYAVIALPSRK